VTRKQVIWGVIAVVVLLLMVAPLASYCLGREEDYRDKGELRAPPPRLTEQARVASLTLPR
jgi:hypothetical protein